jgi:hypothetical protein
MQVQSLGDIPALTTLLRQLLQNAGYDLSDSPTTAVGMSLLEATVALDRLSRLVQPRQRALEALHPPAQRAGAAKGRRAPDLDYCPMPWIAARAQAAWEEHGYAHAIALGLPADTPAIAEAWTWTWESYYRAAAHEVAADGLLLDTDDVPAQERSFDPFVVLERFDA